MILKELHNLNESKYLAREPGEDGPKYPNPEFIEKMFCAAFGELEGLNSKSDGPAIKISWDDSSHKFKNQKAFETKVKAAYKPYELSFDWGSEELNINFEDFDELNESEKAESGRTIKVTVYKDDEDEADATKADFEKIKSYLGHHGKVESSHFSPDEMSFMVSGVADDNDHIDDRVSTNGKPNGFSSITEAKAKKTSKESTDKMLRHRAANLNDKLFGKAKQPKKGWKLKHRGETYEVVSVKAAVKKYDQLRDESYEGASTFEDGVVTDGSVKYRISYNGRVWDGKKEVKV